MSWHDEWIDYCSDVLQVSDASSGRLAQAQEAFKYAYLLGRRSGLEEGRKQGMEKAHQGHLKVQERWRSDDPLGHGGPYDSSWYQKMPS